MGSFFKIGGDPVGTWRDLMGRFASKVSTGITKAGSMAASMVLREAQADLSRNNLERWTDSLYIDTGVGGSGALGNMRLYLTLDPPAAIFATGGEIHGNPLLWIPLSGTDAAGIRASAFPGGLVSSKYPLKGGRPLLFSTSDRQPKYFGIESVNVPKRLHLEDDVNIAMNNFRSVFADTMASS